MARPSAFIGCRVASAVKVQGKAHPSAYIASGHLPEARTGVTEMKYQDVAQTYDNLFKEDMAAKSWESWNNGEPVQLVKALESFIASGDVLDIGAGVGQNSIYLASRGFNVLATDISTAAIERIQARAQALAVSLRTDVHDIVEEELENAFDAIICAGVLHHLYTDDALSVIKKIQHHTKPMGFNVINTFTKRGDFYTKNPSTKRFYVDSNDDLNKLYSNWTVHISFEQKGPAYQKGPGGETLFNVFAGMLSQKK
jgi:2-polyprenyl-3-methyl-5-hydroxy-6-metoxy-1,4-benzoquinol methylase